MATQPELKCAPRTGRLFREMLAQLRYMRTLDEFQRRIQLDAVVSAAGFIAFATLAYGTLEALADFPAISLMWIFPAFCVAWSAASVIVRWRYK